ncbi:hypothetical protein D9M69_419530 [compost metagenome]
MNRVEANKINSPIQLPMVRVSGSAVCQIIMKPSIAPRPVRKAVRKLAPTSAAIFNMWIRIFCAKLDMKRNFHLNIVSDSSARRSVPYHAISGSDASSASKIFLKLSRVPEFAIAGIPPSKKPTRISLGSFAEIILISCLKFDFF